MSERQLAGACVDVILPCYNEAEVIKATHQAIVGELGEQPFELRIVYVDDGSQDRTPEILDELARSDSRVLAVHLTRNFGHQAAVTAGLSYSRGDAVIVMDADLQDPPGVVLEMLALWIAGDDVVNAIRAERKESLFKRFAYFAFYRIYRPLVDIDVPVDSGDFSLMDRRVVDALNALPEKNRFVRGLRSWVGFRQSSLVYARDPRAAGETKYPMSRLLRLALDGIFNFSFKPLSFLLWSGVALFVLSLLLAALFVISRLTGLELLGQQAGDVPGFTTVIIVILFFGSVQLLSVGVLGEYLARIYQEVKQRPTFLVSRTEGDARADAGGATDDS